jgi:ribose-phosphate pyrophosphokinase
MCLADKQRSILMAVQESATPLADGVAPVASSPAHVPDLSVLQKPQAPSTATLSDSDREDSDEGDLSSVELALERRAAVSFGSHRMKVFSGSSNLPLATAVARYVGKPNTSAILRKKFADNESYVRIEESVRGCNVFLVQSTSNPGNDTLIELLIMIDACRRAHAHQITAVIPYYGYSRADRLIDADKRRREALTSKLVANMLCAAGTDRVVFVDIHSPQTCGFFDIPVDHIYACSVLVGYLNKKNLKDIVVVAPDVGGVGRARAFAKHAGDAPLAIIDKRRDGHNMSTVLNLVGDVKGKTAVLVDDMIDTAGTICNAAAMLRQRGARQVFAVATHPVFSGQAVERLSSGVFEEVIVCDTIHVPPSRRFPQLTVLSVSALIGEQIWRVHEQSSR